VPSAAARALSAPRSRVAHPVDECGGLARKHGPHDQLQLALTQLRRVVRSSSQPAQHRQQKECKYTAALGGEDVSQSKGSACRVTELALR
jgi:hypothetical protein